MAVKRSWKPIALAWNTAPARVTTPRACRDFWRRSRAVNRDQYLERIRGLVFGDRVEDGIVRANEFVHPLLRIGVKFPEGWEITNTPEAVMAQEPGTKHFLVLQEVEQVRGRSIGETAVAAMRRSGYSAVDGRVDRVNGNEAHVGLYRGDAKDVGKVLMRAAHIAIGRQLYVIAGFAPEKEFEQVDKEILPSVQSFRQLAAAEASRIRPNRIDFHVVKPGDSWQSIAARQGRSFVNAATLAIMNDREVHVQPTPGERVKIVVEG